FVFFFLSIPLHPRSTLFPYTTLFRSDLPAAFESIERLGRREIVSLAVRDRQAQQLSLGTPRREGRVRLLDPHVDVLASKLQPARSEEHTSELQSRSDLVCRLLLEKKN